jgi:hypothetical protein
MPRPKENIHLEDFKSRLEWIVKHLDTDPSFARFCVEVDDIEAHLSRAIEAGSAPFRPLTAQSWNRAKRGYISRIFIDWLLMLYPDLTERQLLAKNFDEFCRGGQNIVLARERWQEPIRYLAANRRSVANHAKRFYSSIDEASVLHEELQPFPLIVKRGWIRDKPLELTQKTEEEWLSVVGKSRKFSAPKLEGLTGDFVSYKGATVYKGRRGIKKEPQHNGQIFCVDGVKFDNRSFFIGFNYSLAHYYDYVNTCEILGVEYADAILRKTTHQPFAFRGEPEAAFDFSRRAAYPGVNCLSIFLNHNIPGALGMGERFLVHLRDETQLQAQNTLHVLPAGGHQPFSQIGNIAETSLWRTIVREFFEELFDKEELFMQPQPSEDFFQYPKIKKLLDVFFTGSQASARVYLFGFGLDPVTLKPEVLAAIVIDWKKAIGQIDNLRLKFNWEVQSRDGKKARCEWVPLSKPALRAHATEPKISLDGVFLDPLPAGGACMFLGAHHLDALLG